jgi:hypothetical protein
MKRMLVFLAVLLVLGAGTLVAQTPGPPAPPSMQEQMTQMMDLVSRMQEQMNQMQDQMKAMQGPGASRGCPAMGGGGAPKQGG